MAVVTDPSDPRRCRSADKHGQCWNIAEVGQFCPTHRPIGQLSPEGERRRIYNLTRSKFRERLDEMMLLGPAEDDFEEEIRLTQILLEDTLNNEQIKDQLVLNREHHAFMATLAKLKKASRDMKEKGDQFLGRPAIIIFSQQIIQLLAEELHGIPGFENTIDRITERMLDVIEHTTNPSEDSNGVPNETA